MLGTDKKRILKKKQLKGKKVRYLELMIGSSDN